MRWLSLGLVVAALLAAGAAEGDASATRATRVGVRDEIVFTRTVRQFGRPDLYVMASDGSRLRLLTRNAGDPAVSPDGASIAFVRKETQSTIVCGVIWLMRRDGSAQRQLTKPASRPKTCDMDPAWSPDGKTIYFSRNRTSQNGYFESSLFAIGVDNADLRPLTRATLSEDGDCHVGPAPSPNGRLIAFAHFSPCRRTLQSAIQAVTTAGRRARLPFSTDVGVYVEWFDDPAWAPDGRRLAFSANDSLEWERPVVSGLYVSSLGKGRPRQLAKGYEISDSAWSRDGAAIAFTREDDIWVVGSNGKGLRRITRTRADDRSPTWLPPAA